MQFPKNACRGGNALSAPPSTRRSLLSFYQRNECVAGTFAALAAWALLACSVSAFAQSPTDWPPVLPADLALKDNPASLGSSAILLDRSSMVDDNKATESEYYRIKIFNKDGLKYADIEVPYVLKQEEVRDLRARMIRPDGTPVEFHGDILDKLIVKSKRLRYQAKLITLPEVQPGSIIEYAYTLAWHQHAPDILKNPSNYWIDGLYSVPTVHWTLQHELFTRHARFSLRYLPKGTLDWALIRPPNGAAVQRKGDGTVELEVHDVPPIEEEEFAPPADMINSRVHFFYLVGFGPNANYWRDLARREAQDIDKFIGRSKKIQQATTRLVAPGDSPDAKLRKIYARVQQLRYISYEPRKSSQETKRENLKDNKDVEDVWEHGYGYANEINYLFIAMARSAGIDAWLVRLTDRSRSILDPVVLDSSQLDTAVVLVRIDNKNLFFDPATRFCPYGLLPWGETGVKGIQIAAGGDFGSIPGRGPDTAVTTRTATVKLAPDGTVEGTVHISYAGQEALQRRLELYVQDDAGRRKALEDEIKSVLPPSATVTVTHSDPWESSEEDLRVDATFTVPDFASVAGHRLVFPLAVFHSTRTNPFKAEKRNYPIYFDYAYQATDAITWQFPEGFHVEGLPTPQFYQNNFYKYQIKLTTTPSGLEFHRSSTLNGFVFDAGSYRMLKTMYDTTIRSDTEPAILQQDAKKP